MEKQNKYSLWTDSKVFSKTGLRRFRKEHGSFRRTNLITMINKESPEEIKIQFGKHFKQVGEICVPDNLNLRIPFGYVSLSSKFYKQFENELESKKHTPREIELFVQHMDPMDACGHLKNIDEYKHLLDVDLFRYVYLSSREVFQEKSQQVGTINIDPKFFRSNPDKKIISGFDTTWTFITPFGMEKNNHYLIK